MAEKTDGYLSPPEDEENEHEDENIGLNHDKEDDLSLNIEGDEEEN